MNIIAATDLNDEQKLAVYELWNNEYPSRIGYATLADFDTYLDNLNDKQHYLLMDNGSVKGWMFRFMRDGQLWFAIILDSAIHGQGFGTRLLDMLKSTTVKLNGWVVDHNQDAKRDGTTYQSPLAFYLKNNFVVRPESRIETEKISAVKIEWEDLSPTLSEGEGGDL